MKFNNAGGWTMLRFLSFVPLFVTVLAVISTCSLAFARSFDWQYGRIGTPFAVFYNPSLIGSNPGHTFGFDMRSDSTGYDLRGALVVPVSRIRTREAFIRDDADRYFGYSNQSYKSSKYAVSIGGVYAGPSEYRLSAGFAAPIYQIQSGVSFDLTYRDEYTTGAVNLAFNAMPKVMMGNVLYLGFNNLAVSKRDDMNDLKISVGAAGVLASGGPLSLVPYDLIFASYFKDNGISLMEGTARVSLDLTTQRTSGEKYGQLPSAAFGYTLVRSRGGESYSHRIFANFGITFVNKLSSAAVLGSYGFRDGRENEKNAAFFYSMFNHCPTGTDNSMTAALGYEDTSDGKILFALKSASAGAAVSSWVLRVENPRGGIIRTFSGGNTVPSSILWDGLTGDGSAVEEDVVFAKLVLKGGTRVVESDTIEIPIR
jgi:hypothetical protein